jgi:hypothetical protein
MKKTALGLRGAVVGALIGCLSLVFSGEFKVAEPEFTASYIGYLIPAKFWGLLSGFRGGGNKPSQLLSDRNRLNAPDCLHGLW